MNIDRFIFYRRQFFLDSRSAMYRDSVSDFACLANERTGGLVIERIERGFDAIFIDEVQDLVGYDLELLDLLFACNSSVSVVGDPRQHTYSTNQGSKNKKYQGAGFMSWLGMRTHLCQVDG